MRTSATAATAAAHLGRGRPDIVTEPSGVLHAGRCGILEFLTTRAGAAAVGNRDAVTSRSCCGHTGLRRWRTRAAVAGAARLSVPV